MRGGVSAVVVMSTECTQKGSVAQLARHPQLTRSLALADPMVISLQALSSLQNMYLAANFNVFSSQH